MSFLKFNEILDDVVTLSDIRLLEEEINHHIPDDLKLFYLKYGCGVVFGDDPSKLDYINTLMHPLDIIDFIRHQDFFEFLEDLDLYDADMYKQVQFCDIGEGTFLAFGIDNSNFGKILKFDTVVADSFNEFMNKLLVKPDFYFFVE